MRIKGLLCLVLALVLLLSGCAAPELPGDPNDANADGICSKVYVEGDSFYVNGEEWWISGINTPWQYWNDFEGNFNEEFWDLTFARLKRDKINCTRIWINCAGMGTVTLSRGGEVKSINQEHWTDLEKLFKIASKHEVYIFATLLSFDHFKETQPGHPHWREMITSEENSKLFADTYVKEFCTRFGEEEFLFAIDLMNEPDWVNENEECGQISWTDLSYFFGVCADTVHQYCSTPVSVGVGMPKYISDNHVGNMLSDERLLKLTDLEGAYLDFNSPHYYPWEKPWYHFPFDRTVADWGIDDSKPCILGECVVNDLDDSGYTLSEEFEMAYNNGYSGVMPWVQHDTNDESGWGGYSFVSDAARHMYTVIPEKILPNEQ